MPKGGGTRPFYYGVPKQRINQTPSLLRWAIRLWSDRRPTTASCRQLRHVSAVRNGACRRAGADFSSAHLIVEGCIARDALSRNRHLTRSHHSHRATSPTGPLAHILDRSAARFVGDDQTGAPGLLMFYLHESCRIRQTDLPARASGDIQLPCSGFEGFERIERGRCSRSLWSRRGHSGGRGDQPGGDHCNQDQRNARTYHQSHHPPRSAKDNIAFPGAARLCQHRSTNDR